MRSLLVLGVLMCCAPVPRAVRSTRDDVLCHLKGTQWRGEAPVLTASGEATLGYADPGGELAVEGDLVFRGRDVALVGTFSGEGLTLDARVDLTRGGGVFLARPVTLPGLGALLAGTAVGLRRELDGQLLAYPARGELEHVRLLRPVELSITCADLTLDSPGGKTLERRAEAAGFSALGVGKLERGPLPLAAEPAGVPIAEVGAEHPIMVAMLERGEGQTRIALSRGRGAVWVGWVPADAVKPGGGGMVKLLGKAGALAGSDGALFGTLLGGPSPVACGEDVAVKTRVDGKIVTLGRAAAGRHFWARGSQDELTEIDLGGWFRPAKKVQLLVDARAASCTTAK